MLAQEGQWKTSRAVTRGILAEKSDANKARAHTTDFTKLLSTLLLESCNNSALPGKELAATGSEFD